MEATHVIIRGHVFTRQEKEPFAVSGQSILGALEYNEDSDTVKCHECGEWLGGLGTHIKVHGGISRAQYNERHGLTKLSALSAIGTRKKCSANSKRLHTVKSIKRHVSIRGQRRPRSVEAQNQNSICAAQLLFRLQVAAATVGHTPTEKEMVAAGLSRHSLKARFGSMEAAMDTAGLQSNSGGAPSPLPRNFPSRAEIESRWNARMPWPSDYFEVKGLKWDSSINSR